MRKLAILITMLMCLVTTRAQHDTLPYYVGVPQFYMDHSILEGIDTVFQYERWCYIPWANIQAGNGIPPVWHLEISGLSDIAIRYKPDSTMHIIGIAAPIPCGVTESIHPTTDTFDIDEHLSNLYKILNHTHEEYDSIWFRVYQPVDSHMTLVKSVVMDTSFDTANARLYLPMHGFDEHPFFFSSRYPFGSRNPFNWWLPDIMLEVYFDSELDLSDSFYISYNVRKRGAGGAVWDPFTWFFVGNPYGADPFVGIRDKSSVATDDDPWNYYELRGYPLLFPIIRRDCDSCPQARGLQYIRSSTNKAFFKWQRGTNHHDWQISYGPAGTLPEDGTLMDCKQVQSGLVTLDPDSHYVAYVRARCKFARYEYGPWSAPLTFSLNGGNSIDDIGLPDITITPNPASEQVTVAATGMESVELLGVDGTVIMRREGLMQDEYTLDLKGLAAGVYMVRVSTANGTATRRLMVQ